MYQNSPKTRVNLPPTNDRHPHQRNMAFSDCSSNLIAFNSKFHGKPTQWTSVRIADDPKNKIEGQLGAKDRLIDMYGPIMHPNAGDGFSGKNSTLRLSVALDSPLALKVKEIDEVAREYLFGERNIEEFKSSYNEERELLAVKVTFDGENRTDVYELLADGSVVDATDDILDSACEVTVGVKLGTMWNIMVAREDTGQPADGKKATKKGKKMMIGGHPLQATCVIARRSPELVAAAKKRADEAEDANPKPSKKARVDMMA